MTLEYQLTFADFSEAHDYCRQYRFQKNRIVRRNRLLPRTAMDWWSTFGMVLFFAVLFTLYRLLIVLEPPERAVIPKHGAAFFDVMAPLFFACASAPLWMVLFYNRAMGWRGIALILLLLGCLVLIGVLIPVVAYVRRQIVPPPPPRPPLQFLALVVPHLSWMVYTLSIVVVMKLILKTRLRVEWNAQSHLHLMHTLQATVERVTIGTATSTHHYEWSAITAFVQTPRTFLLLFSDAAYHVIPKRAFASTEQIDAFAQMLRTFIANPKAFPVVQTPGPDAGCRVGSAMRTD